MTSAPERKALLVGSLPFNDEPEAMRVALTSLGPHLDSLPDGEIGEKSADYPKGDRAAWVQTIMDRCEADTSAWTVRRPTRRNGDGYSVDYESGPRLKGKYRPSEMADRLDFGWSDWARRSYPVFQELRAELGQPGLRFQVGLPTAMGMTFGILSPIDALRYASAFNRRLAREANEILSFTDAGDVRFQLEVPGELAMAYRLPKFAVDLALRTVVGLADQIEAGAGFGIHLCLGDLNNEALIKADSLDKMVHFSNRLMARWPGQHRLEYVHVPLAEAADPPPLDPSWYRPLANMALPPGVRFVAGFVHPKRTEAEHDRIREILDGLRPQPVDIASSCGLGRQSRAAAELLLERTASLAAKP